MYKVMASQLRVTFKSHLDRFRQKTVNFSKQICKSDIFPSLFDIFDYFFQLSSEGRSLLILSPHIFQNTQQTNARNINIQHKKRIKSVMLFFCNFMKCLKNTKKKSVDIFMWYLKK